MPVTPLSCAPEELSIVIEAAAAENPSARQHALEARWAEMTAANPRLFNGPILAFDRYDATTQTIHAKIDEFKHLAVSAAFPDDGFRLAPPITILSVTGVLTATTNDGARCVCVAKRSHSTRVYGGQWELAPSGGIDVPNNNPGPLFDGSLAANALKIELAEELNLDAHTCDWPSARLLGLVLDEQSGSLDIMFHVEHTPPLSAQADTPSVQPGLWPARENASWEYEAVRWVLIDELPEFVRAFECIGPMVEMVEAGLLNGL